MNYLHYVLYNKSVHLSRFPIIYRDFWIKWVNFRVGALSTLIHTIHRLSSHSLV